MGQNLFINGILTQVPQYTPLISAESVIKAGATNLNSLTQNSTIFHDLQIAYSNSVTHTLYFALGTAAVSLSFALCMEWKNVAKISEQRRQEDRSVKEPQNIV